MVLTDADIRDLIVLLGFVTADPAMAYVCDRSEVWLAGRRLAEKCGGSIWVNFIATEQELLSKTGRTV